MAALMASVRGHDDIVERLQIAAKTQQLGPVQLFSGPSGVGKRRVALGLAQVLLCSSKTGCGECSNCLRVEAGQHEGLLVVENEGFSLKIEQAHKVLEFLRLRSWSQNRAILLDDAALMTPAAANSLLKALEEPFAGTHFFLITSSPFSVLPTVRSRAQSVRFQPIHLDILRELSTNTDEWILRAAEGQLDRLQQLRESDQQTVRKKAFAVLNDILGRKVTESRDALASLVSSADDGLSVVRLWIQFVRDAIVTTVTSQSLDPASSTIIHRDLWQGTGIHRTRTEYFDIFQTLLRMEQDLLHHIDRNLVFENFIFNTCSLGSAI